ncbi:unnamed protein product [Diplocarpon coronariae]|nr:hypothetical protein JHW43_006997 [Diplocarpon mali]
MKLSSIIVLVQALGAYALSQEYCDHGSSVPPGSYCNNGYDSYCCRGREPTDPFPVGRMCRRAKDNEGYDSFPGCHNGGTINCAYLICDDVMVGGGKPARVAFHIFGVECARLVLLFRNGVVG